MPVIQSIKIIIWPEILVLSDYLKAHFLQGQLYNHANSMVKWRDMCQ